MKANHLLATKVSTAIDRLNDAGSILRQARGFEMHGVSDVQDKVVAAAKALQEVVDGLAALKAGEPIFHFAWPDYENRTQEVKVGLYRGQLYEAEPGRVTWYVSKDYTSSDVLIEGEGPTVPGVRAAIEAYIMAASIEDATA
jgi:hypothetical protein